MDKQDCAEQWLEWITCVMTERHFIIDYNSLFPLQDDIDLMIQMSIPMYEQLPNVFLCDQLMEAIVGPFFKG